MVKHLDFIVLFDTMWNMLIIDSFANYNNLNRSKIFFMDLQFYISNVFPKWVKIKLMVAYDYENERLIMIESQPFENLQNQGMILLFFI